MLKVLNVFSQNYAYRAYIENILNFEPDSALQHLYTVGGFQMDEVSKFDIFSENDSGLERGLLFRHEEEVDLISRIHVDVLNSSKYLPNNIDFGLTFELSQEKFYLMKKTETNLSTLKIIDASLYVDKIKLNPEVTLAHEKLLLQKNAVIPYKRVDVKNYTIGANKNSFALDNVLTYLITDVFYKCMI